MPTYDDYREAATRYRQLSGRFDDAIRLPDAFRTSGAIGDGAVREALTASMRAVVDDLSVAADECLRIAAVCEVRAEVCAEYRRQMWRYLSRASILPTERPPARPAPWVES